MSQTVQSNPRALVESIARILPPSAQDDFRNLMNEFLIANITALSPGGNPIQIGGPSAGSSAAPVGVTHTVSGANGVFTATISNPPTAKSTTIYHEISYSPLKSFTQGVTTLEPTTATNVTLPAPGASFYFRVRSSFDKKTWSNYQLSSVAAIDAGLVESSAVAAGAAFNQSNFAQVNSSAATGGSATITVSGASSTLSSYTAVKGAAQQIRPSATIVGIQPSTDQFIGWDGVQFRAKPTLASVLADSLEPVGKVSVVSNAAPSNPVILPIVTAGSVLGYHITSGGAGASQDYVLTVTGGGGSGATTGAQTIQNGVLISVAPGDAGTGYGGGTTVAVSGGGPGGGGGTGGGTAVGGNGARMTNV